MQLVPIAVLEKIKILIYKHELLQLNELKIKRKY